MKISLIGVGLTVVVLVSGCAGEPSPDPTAATSASSTPTPTSTPTPEPTKPALSELVLSADGLGYVRVGSPVPEQPAALAIVSMNPNSCGSPDEPVELGWDSTYSPAGFRLTISPDGAVDGIFVEAPEITTPEGIHVGSTEAEVVAAYGPPVESNPDGAADVYRIDGSTGVLIVEVAADRNLDLGYESQVGTVLWMRAELPSNYLGSVANSAWGQCI